jgi:tetratricopeptide (TPR) repeat protein
MSLSAGTRLGPYEIIGALGAGGMGEVYRARDSRLERVVAVKVLPDASAGDPELLARFEREAKAIATLHHPHICTVHDVGFERGSHFIVMELIEGQTLHDRIQRGPVAREEAVAIALQLCDALAAAHARGIVHRDLKPGNVILARDAGGTPSAKLLDFGLARFTGGAVASDIASRATVAPVSTQGEVLGTVRYMAPEQLRGEIADHRADIWAMGCLLYEMLTGQDVRTRHPISPRHLESTIARCLREHPGDRYASALHLAADLQKVAKPSRVALFAAALGLAALALLAMLVTFYRAGPPLETAGPARAPMSIVIADFENRTGDSVFDGALEHAIAIGLETASFLSVVPRQNALASAAAVGGRLDPSTARLVAQRDGIGAVVSGVVSTTPSGYVVTTSILDPVPGTPIVSARQTAATKEDVLAAMAAIARELRRGLGDHELSSAAEFERETFTTSSLDAAREYSLAQAHSSAGREEQAIEHYRAAIRHDPLFGRAHAGLGLVTLRLGRTSAAREHLGRALSLRDRMTERERLRTEGLVAVTIDEDFDRGVVVFQQLVDKYPGDRSAMNNLAVAQFRMLQLEEATATGRRVVGLEPLARNYANLALYAMYAGDLSTARDEAERALQLSPQIALAILPLAVSDILNGQFESARLAYARMAKTGARGAALAVIGEADLGAMQGHYVETVRAITVALTSDLRNNASAIGALRLLRAELALEAGDRTRAADEARAALALDSSLTAVFRAADILVLSGDTTFDGSKHVDTLSAKPSAMTNWYRRILLARLGAARGTFTALDALEEAFARERPMWIAHFAAGTMQLARGRPKEALAHLNWCLEHAAAGSAAFLDDVPTLRYLPQARYWRARALEASSDPAAAAAYEQFLRLRRGGPDDQLARDARERWGALSR